MAEFFTDPARLLSLAQQRTPYLLVSNLSSAPFDDIRRVHDGMDRIHDTLNILHGPDNWSALVSGVKLDKDPKNHKPDVRHVVERLRQHGVSVTALTGPFSAYAKSLRVDHVFGSRRFALAEDNSLDGLKAPLAITPTLPPEIVPFMGGLIIVGNNPPAVADIKFAIDRGQRILHLPAQTLSNDSRYTDVDIDFLMRMQAQEHRSSIVRFEGRDHGRAYSILQSRIFKDSDLDAVMRVAAASEMSYQYANDEPSTPMDRFIHMARKRDDAHGTLLMVELDELVRSGELNSFMFKQATMMVAAAVASFSPPTLKLKVMPIDSTLSRAKMTFTAVDVLFSILESSSNRGVHQFVIQLINKLFEKIDEFAETFSKNDVQRLVAIYDAESHDDVKQELEAIIKSIDPTALKRGLFGQLRALLA